MAAIRAESAVPISVDTSKAEVARLAVAAGADIWNDVTALTGPAAMETAAELGCGVVLMHMQGEPRTMQADPRYADVVAEVRDVLSSRAAAAMAAGVQRDRIWIDPGVGFGKRLEHNLALLSGLGRPGRTRLSGRAGREPQALHPVHRPERPQGERPPRRLPAAALLGADRGAAVLRVHDVRQTAQAVAVRHAILQAKRAMKLLAANPWVALFFAGLLEVAWATAFKFAFRSNHLLTAGTVAAMGGSFWLLSLAMRTLPVGTAYAVWTGIGAAGAAMLGVLLYREPVTAIRVLSIAAIIGGVVGLRVSGSGH
jgi:dihydropteroate synthase